MAKGAISLRAHTTSADETAALGAPPSALAAATRRSVAHGHARVQSSRWMASSQSCSKSGCASGSPEGCREGRITDRTRRQAEATGRTRPAMRPPAGGPGSGGGGSGGGSSVVGRALPGPHRQDPEPDASKPGSGGALGQHQLWCPWGPGSLSFSQMRQSSFA